MWKICAMHVVAICGSTAVNRLLGVLCKLESVENWFL